MAHEEYDPADIQKGETRGIYGWAWLWVPDNGVLRGHWLATDGSGIAVTLPSDIYEFWLVTISHDGHDELIRKFEDGDAAFDYAARKRLASAN